MSCCLGTEDRCTWWKLGHRFELTRCLRLIIHQGLWSRVGSFGWIKIGDRAFLVYLVCQKPGRPVPQQSPAQEGIYCKVLAGGDAVQSSEERIW